MFEFIESDADRYQLEEDLAELNKSMSAGSYKASIILIGSLIESALYYYILQTPSLRKSINNFSERKWALSGLLSIARDTGLINEVTFKSCLPIMNLRNVVHPKVQKEIGDRPSEYAVKQGYNLLLEVCRVANEHKTRSMTSTYDGAIEDLVLDVSGRNANESDKAVYRPILNKYGFSWGKLIIERSLKKSK